MCRPKKLSKRQRQKKFLRALRNNYGFKAKALKAAGIPPRTFYNWLATDEVFKREYSYLWEEFADLAMEKLMMKIEEGNTTAIIFYARHFLKDRGYA